MRFRGFIGILFFLTLKETEEATQAPCSTEISRWHWLYQTRELKTCILNIDVGNDEDFTILSDDRLTLGLRLGHKKVVKFLPTNVFSVFPELVAFDVSYCAITTVSRNHFRNMSKLESLQLVDNKIEHVVSDAFVDLVSLNILYLDNNEIQSLSASTFSPLKALKELFLNGNKIQHLDPQIFNSLVKVEAISLHNNSIAALDEKIFESLFNLRVISLSKNKLESIPGNLFQNNLKLKTIYLDNNEIKFIDANMFDHLPNLITVDLKGNICVNKNYGKESFETMRSDLKQTCETSSAA